MGDRAKLHPQVVRDVILTGKRYDAAECLTLGIIDKALASDDDITAASVSLAEEVPGGGRETVVLTKERIYDTAIQAQERNTAPSDDSGERAKRYQRARL